MALRTITIAALVLVSACSKRHGRLFEPDERYPNTTPTTAANHGERD